MVLLQSCANTIQILLTICLSQTCAMAHQAQVLPRLPLSKNLSSLQWHNKNNENVKNTKVKKQPGFWRIVRSRLF